LWANLFVRFYWYIRSVTVKDYLLGNHPLNLSEVARLMWPNNPEGARAYLDKKLRGLRPWTDKDSRLALTVLKGMCVDISKLKAPKKDKA
jgi:DNA-binding SARP family transcriptional activator